MSTFDREDPVMGSCERLVPTAECEIVCDDFNPFTSITHYFWS